jgi:hypothetical protein
MDTLSIDILNPKAKKLLQDLADMKLIAIRDSSQNRFLDTLDKLRSTKGSISVEEITSEVELVRSRSEKIDAMKRASSDPLFLADIKEIASDFNDIDHESL